MRGFMVATLMTLAALAGCVDSNQLSTVGDEILTPGGLPPAAAIPDVIESIRHVAHGDGVPAGAGIWVDGAHAYVGALGDGFYVLDIMDPENPTIVGSLSGSDAFYVRDVDVYWAQERKIAVGAGQGTGMHFIDVTDPTAPRLVSTLTVDQLEGQPVHNNAVVTGTTLIYNTPSTGEGNPNHIVDGSDPANPRIVGTAGTHGCHDVTVRVDLNRAYCAGYQESQIWDITDPLNVGIIGTWSDPRFDTFGQARRELPPEATGQVNEVRGMLPDEAPRYSLPPRGLHHLALANHDGTIMILGDEWQGGGEPGACFVSTQAPTGQSASTPMGALFFVDVRDEANPELLSWFTPPMPDPDDPDASCTSHFGSLVPGREQVLMAWYHSGLVLVDFTDAENPYMVTRWMDGTNVWDVKIHEGWLVTGDLARGTDVLKFE